MEVVQELAKQLGVATDSLLKVYTPYYFGFIIGETVTLLILFVISAIVCVLSLKAMMYNYNICKDSDNLNVWICGTVSFIFALILFGILLGLITNFPRFIGTIMSPQGAAISDIVTKVVEAGA